MRAGQRPLVLRTLARPSTGVAGSRRKLALLATRSTEAARVATSAPSKDTLIAISSRVMPPTDGYAHHIIVAMAAPRSARALRPHPLQRFALPPAPAMSRHGQQ